MQTLCCESKSNNRSLPGSAHEPVAGSSTPLHLRENSPEHPAAGARFALSPWSHLAPRGEFVHAESGTLQVIDDPALDAILNQFRDEAARPNFPGLLVDFDHFSYDPDKPSTAAGWVTEMERRDDGLWGRVRWTEAGERALANGEYRFVSPTWLRKDMRPAPVGAAGAEPSRGALRRARPVRLDSLALTNSPNLGGMVPLSNSRSSLPPREAATEAGPTTKTTTNRKMKSVCSLLGLSPDAAEDAVHSEVTKLQNRATAAEGAIKPLQNRLAQMEADHSSLLAAQIESDLELNKNRFPATEREKWKNALLANRRQSLDLLQGLPSLAQRATEGRVDSTGRPKNERVHNRATAGDPGQRLALDAAETDTPRARAAAAAIRNRATELRSANKKLTYDQAFQAAKNELAQG